MSWLLHRGVAFAGLPVVSLALMWGCANGTASDEASSIDPTMPEVDAAFSPSPMKGRDTSTSDPADDPDPEPSSKDAKDAGGTTTTPPTQTATKPSQGEVLITEVMYDPSGVEPASEWIELHNTTSSPRILSGLTIVDGGNRTHVIASGVTIAAGAYAVLVRNDTVAATAKVPASAILYEYGAGQADNVGIQLANGSTGSLELRDGSTIIAQAHYGGWFAGSASIQLKTPTYSSSAQASGWCLSSVAWTSGSDKGTPGAASDCP